MKKKTLKITGILVLFCAVVFAGVTIYMNLHTSMWHDVDSRLSEKEILKECPQIALTDQDQAMAAALLALPEVWEVAGDEKGQEIHSENVDKIQAQYAPDADFCTIYVYSYEDNLGVNIDLIQNEEMRIRTTMTFSSDPEKAPYKWISFYEIDNDDSANKSYQMIYKNTGNEDVHKYFLKRDWFYFLKHE